jgi:tetratricopeptide (TPR) repeat protein
LQAGERSLVLGERAGAVDVLVAGNMSAGEIYRTLGDYHKAKKHLEDAVALIDSRDERKHWGQVGLPSVRVRSHLAWTLAELGDFTAARNVAGEAMRLANDSSHPYTLCHACLGLGGTRVRQGEFEPAIGVLGRGYDLSERVPVLRPSIAADLGVAHAHCGNVAEGLAHVNAAVEGATAMGRLSRLPLLLVKSAQVHLLAGNTTEASALAGTALRLATEQKERGNEMYARLILAEICACERPGSRDAERQYLDALGLASNLAMRPLAAHTHAGLWRLYRRRAELAKAQEHLAAATAMYRDMGMRYWLDVVESDITDRQPS